MYINDVFTLTYCFVRTWFCLFCHFYNYCYNNYIYVAYLLMDSSLFLCYDSILSQYNFFYHIRNIQYSFPFCFVTSYIALHAFSPLQYAVVPLGCSLSLVLIIPSSSDKACWISSTVIPRCFLNIVVTFSNLW